MKRPICLHLHIFKNAGSSFDDALARFFGTRFASVDGPYPWSVLPPEFLGGYLEHHPSLSALSTHQGRFPMPRSDSYGVLPVVFIRDPIDRLGSVYAYERHITSDAPGPAKARELSLPDYVRWRTSGEGSRVITNFQVTFLAAIEDLFTASPGESDLALAIARLGESAVVGTVERFDESVMVAEHVLDEFFSGIDLSLLVLNESGRHSDRSTRIHKIREDLGEELFGEVSDLNALDSRLHAAANAILDARLAQIPDVEKRLAEFRRRCLDRAVADSRG